MDIDEIRVVRRKAPIIARAVQFRGHFVESAIKQGLITQTDAAATLLDESNKTRICTFLESLESLPGPRVAFQKLCYLLEHQGYSWICDELWVELICEKGDLIIEAGVYEEAKTLVRQRLERKRILDDADMAELTLLIATRYQVAKETFRRQASRSQRQRALDKLVVEQDIQGLCSQIDRCMTVSARTISTGGDSACSRTTSDVPLPEGASIATPKAQNENTVPSHGNKSNQERELTRWVHSLKSKINTLTNAYVSQVMSVPPKHRKRKDARHEEGEILLEEDDRATSGVENSSDGDDTIDSAYYDDISDRQIRQKRRSRELKSAQLRAGLPLHIRTGQNQAPDTDNKSVSVLDKYKRTRGSGASDVGKSRSANSNKVSKRRKRRKATEDVDKEDLVDITFELSEAQKKQTADDVRKDIEELRKRETTLRSRRCLSGTVAPRDMSELEQLFWQKRAQSMTKCRKVGYYYFMSEFKRKRCYPCAVEPDMHIKCAWSAKPKYYRGTPTNKLRLPSNLYDNSGWLAAEKGTNAACIDDSSCPGAGPVPGSEDKRCLACAYANKDLTSFYDGVVAPDGSRHFEYPNSKRNIKSGVKTMSLTSSKAI